MCINCYERHGRCHKKICTRVMDINQRDIKDLNNNNDEKEDLMANPTNDAQWAQLIQWQIFLRSFRG